MKCSDSMQAMVTGIWGIAERHDRLHPEDLKRKNVLVAFLEALWGLDEETFFVVVHAARAEPAVLFGGHPGAGARFAEAALRLRDSM